VVDLRELAAGLEVGASVSVDGVCQTVAALDGTLATFQAVSETLRLTTLDEVRVGRRVSVERAARVGDEVGGHEVSGHVMGQGTVVGVVRQPLRHEVVVAVPQEWRKYLMKKGFVAIDGSSLTVADVAHSADAVLLSVHLVPETVRITNLGSLQVGERVNVEIDAGTLAVVETVERVLTDRNPSGSR
jgi:riboflavin synthase